MGKKKLCKFFVLFVIVALEVVVIIVSDLNAVIFLGTIVAAFLGITLPYFGYAIVDFLDNTNWKTSQRKLTRGKILKRDEWIRISFAYLFRIKVKGKYFLVKNARGTGKFQPVGGAYKMNKSEKAFINKNFNAEDDDKIPIDQTSIDDYRLRIKNKFLRRFVKRFDVTDDRENIIDLSREFKEEIKFAPELFGELKYRYCGRHMTDLEFDEHFQCYELLLADIVEVVLKDDQINYLQMLARKEPDNYMLADDSLINSLGVDPDNNQMQEIISEHTKEILLENEEKLLNQPRIGQEQVAVNML